MQAFIAWQSEAVRKGKIWDSDGYVVEQVWRAALEWVKREAISSDERGDISRKIINEEIGDE